MARSVAYDMGRNLGEAVDNAISLLGDLKKSDAKKKAA